MTRAPQPLAEPELPQSREGGGTRAVLYGLMALLVAAGGWMRYGDQLSDVGSRIAALAGVSSAVPAAPHAKALVEFGLLSQADEVPAIAAMQLPPNEAQTLRDAVARRRLRLVQMPIFERDGGSGAIVRVDANGLTRLVRLSASPVVLTIPMDQVGNVSFTLAGPPTGVPVAIGAQTLNGVIGLPPISDGQKLEVGVIAQ